MADDFSQLDDWMKKYARNLSPASRKKLLLAMMRALRKANSQRMARNVNPDGSSMAPRLPRREKQKRGRPSKMFPRLRLQKHMAVRAWPDGGELSFPNPIVSHTASVHHFGLDGFVGRNPDGSISRARYAARRLLGFSDEDVRQVMDAAINHIGKVR